MRCARRRRRATSLAAIGIVELEDACLVERARAAAAGRVRGLPSTLIGRPS